MKKFVATAASFLITLSSLTPAFAWGDEGHQTVGKIASLHIKPFTAQRLAQILRPGDTFSNISTWADTVKERMGSPDPDPDQPLSKRNALRLLAHFIGDLHQPLHVGVGFIDPNGPNHTIRIAKDPHTIRQRNLHHDRGGNQLIIDNDPRTYTAFGILI